MMTVGLMCRFLVFVSSFELCWCFVLFFFLFFFFSFFLIFVVTVYFTQVTPPHVETNQTEAGSDQSDQTETGADRSEQDQASSEKGEEQGDKPDEKKKVLSFVWIR